jgi:hypothetical protein
MTTTNKRYSYLRVTMIWIDVHPAGKTRPTRHTQPTLSPCIVPNHTYLTWSMYSNLSWVTDRFGRIPLLLRKKGSQHNPQHAGWPIRRSIPSFSHKPTNEAVGLSQVSVDDKLLGLLGSYHQHAISTFNTYSRGSTYQSLTDTDGGYNLEGASFPHTTPRASQPTVLPFPPKGPTRSPDYSKSTTDSKVQV